MNGRNYENQIADLERYQMTFRFTNEPFYNEGISFFGHKFVDNIHRY